VASLRCAPLQVAPARRYRSAHPCLPSSHSGLCGTAIGSSKHGDSKMYEQKNILEGEALVRETISYLESRLRQPGEVLTSPDTTRR